MREGKYMGNKLEIIGLGAGDLDQLQLGIYKKLINTTTTIFVRTMDHPVIAALQAEGINFTAFDDYYEAEDQFAEVYERITDRLLKELEIDSVIYAVPGHPMLAEKTVQLLLARGGDQVEVLGGQSYLDDLFTTLKIDPIEGFQFIDGTNFNRSEINYRNNLIFCQVYDRMIASEVKLALLEDLPADYPVTIVEAAGSEQEVVTIVPLEALDRTLEISNLTSVYVPRVPEELLHHTFQSFREVIAKLRGPEGCPWDQEQTHESLKQSAIEEIYELIDAIEEVDEAGIIEELGDVLLQVMMHSQIGEDDGYFSIDDVIKGVTDKMIHRHPHVFGDVQVDSIEDVNSNWEALKQIEKSERNSILDGIPKSLPALHRAFKLEKKVAKVGFDFADISVIWNKFERDASKLQAAIKQNDLVQIEKELGDLLFTTANIARRYKINPELALNIANETFISRFHFIEKQMKVDKIKLEVATFTEMNKYYEQAKKEGE